MNAWIPAVPLVLLLAACQSNPPLPPASDAGAILRAYGSAPDPQLACRLLQAAGCAYGIDDQSFDPGRAVEANCLQRYQSYQIYSGPGEHINAVLATVSEDAVIIAFRGTLPLGSDERTALRDWWQDAEAVLVSDPAEGIPGRVHEGFDRAFRQTWEGDPAQPGSGLKATLARWQQQGLLRGRRLYLTGHSKGGPMALIAAQALRGAGYVPAAVYLFAPARPGNQQFHDAYLGLDIPTWRYENEDDPVPHLPENVDEWLAGAHAVGKARKSGGEDYVSVGNLLYIGSDLALRVDGDALRRFRQAHLKALDTGLLVKPGATFAAIVGAHSIGTDSRYWRGVCGPAQ